MNTGVEAVETGIKLCRKWAYEVKGVPQDKAEIIVCEKNFHGRTSTVISFSSDPYSKNNFGPYIKCKGWETDPNAYIYFTIQGHAWGPICDALGKPEWKDDPAYNTPQGRQPHIMDIFATIEDFIKDKTKYEAVDIFRKFDIPCAPVLSMKELLHDKSLRASGSIVEVPHKVRGSYWTVGSPIKFSDLKPTVTASPLLGEHTDEVLAELGYTAQQIAAMHEVKAV